MSTQESLLIAIPGLRRRFWLLWLVKCVWFDKMWRRAKLWISLTTWTALVKAVNRWKPSQTFSPIWWRVFVKGLIRAISYINFRLSAQFSMFTFYSSSIESVVGSHMRYFPWKEIFPFECLVKAQWRTFFEKMLLTDLDMNIITSCQNSTWTQETVTIVEKVSSIKLCYWLCLLLHVCCSSQVEVSQRVCCSEQHWLDCWGFQRKRGG